MVKEVIYEGREHHYCEDCDLVYKSRDWAEKCEDWCRENASCNVAITNHSIKKTLEDLAEDGK